MSPRQELGAFAAVLTTLVAVFLHESLFGGKVLSPADLLFVSASFREHGGPAFEPANRLLTDPVFQFQPWLEFNRSMIRRGRLPLWNNLAGCGAPHLANGQSAVFDPFHAIAYIGELPQAYAWMAAARLMIAGLGVFVLARAWGLRSWGRWFAGLAFPFCGFLVLWLLYPVASAAVWMPWLLWASDRVLREPSPRRIGLTALFTGLVLLGGHVQTSAHVLLAAGAYVLVMTIFHKTQVPRLVENGPPLTRGGWGGQVEDPLEDWDRPPQPPLVKGGPFRLGRGHENSLDQGRPFISPASPSQNRPRASAWLAGIILGIALAAIEVVPLGSYLTKSPVWQDRTHEQRPPWVLSHPRWLDACCTALPYLFGSQRRGHPHLGRAMGVHNLNESAGGFAGLATLVWLAPWGWWVGRRDPRFAYLAGLVAFGMMGAFGVPPVNNLLRALPVLNVMDNRRLTLWVAFGLIVLGGLGLDALSRPSLPRARRWGMALAVSVAVGLLVGAWGVRRAEPWLESRALRHYAEAASKTPGADPDVYRQRAERQVRQTVDFVPRYLGLAAAQFLALAALAWIGVEVPEALRWPGCDRP